MPIQKIFKDKDNDEFHISEQNYCLAIKNARTHDFEIIIKEKHIEISTDKLNYLKCNNCKVECHRWGKEEVVIKNGKIFNLTCDEVIIKGIIE